MNPINYALDRIINSDIPIEILNEAFMSRRALNDYTIKTLEQRMREVVIDKRIYSDCNIVHPTRINVALSQCKYLRGDSFQSVWYVPKTLTQGKTIVSAIELASAYTATNDPDFSYSSGNNAGLMNSAYQNSGRNGSLPGAGQQMLRSVSPIPLVTNASLHILNENTILVKDAVVVPGTMMLRVAVENDENFNHIRLPYYPLFHELCLLAVQQYIYRTLIIAMDSGFLQGGMELNSFKDEVSKYSDAGELYKEKLEEWTKSAYLMDDTSKQEHYAMITGGGW